MGWELRLFGSVEVLADGRRLDAGPPRQRCVLAAITVDAGRPVPMATVIDRVWGAHIPPRARRTLYVYVARLRAILTPDGEIGGEPPRILSRSHGYELVCGSARVDVLEFRSLLAEARDPATTDPARAALLRRALDLWHGPPFAGLTGDWAAQTGRAWQYQRVDAAVEWAQAELRLANPGPVVGPLTELAAEHPLAEALGETLIRALHAVGRKADALAHYAGLRRRLVAELGVEPRPELRQLHQEILRDEAGTRLRPGFSPAQLPADLRGFTGRLTAIATLDAIGSGGVAAISGTAGVGKTSLAVRWAHRVRQRFPDGQLYVNLHGFGPGPATAPATAIHAFLDAMGVPVERIPAELGARAALYRSVLAGKRMLIVLDNARDADHARPLLPGSAGPVVLVTSRDQLLELIAGKGAQPVALDVLTAGEARDQLIERLGRRRVDAEPTATDRIIASCARLPLALATVAARAAIHPSFPLTALADELTDAFSWSYGTRTPAGELTDVFSWSYRTLTPPAADLFRLLGLHPGPDLSTPAAASLAGWPVRSAHAALDELSRANLISEHRPGRYGFHDLLREYAAALAAHEDPPDRRRLATRRMLDHYLQGALAAARLIHPAHDAIPLDPPGLQAGVTTVTHAGHDAAMAWLTAERPVLIALVTQAGQEGFDTYAWMLPWALTTYLDRRGHWDEWVATHRTAVAVAGRTGPAIAISHRHLGHGLIRLGQHRTAQIHLQQALDHYADLDDRPGQAHTHLNLTLLCERRDDLPGALGHARRALDLFRTVEHPAGLANALNTVGWYQTRLGDHRAAIRHCEEALTLQQRIDDRHEQAATWDSLGLAHHNLAEHDRAQTCYEEAIALWRAIGDRYYEAETTVRLGDTHWAAARPAAARTVWRQALEILDALAHPDADTVRARLAG